jgi:VanZ family protein
MAVIYYFSSQPGSLTPSGSWRIFLERKGAHLIEYAVLGWLFLRLTRRCWPGNMLEAVGWGFVGSLLYAFSDELHQLSVVGREGTIRDVLIDLVGIGLGMLAMRYLLWNNGVLKKYTQYIT